MKEITHGRHISLFLSEGGHPSFTVDDYEIFDLLDDYLTEDCDLDDEFMIFSDHPQEGYYTVWLEGETTYEQLVDLVHKLDLVELDRIYLINNKE